MASEAGKGSARRPGDHATFSANFDRIFGKKGPRPEAFELSGDAVSVVIVDEIAAANDDSASQNEFICHCIERSVGLSAEQIKLAKELINKRMEYSGTLYTWMYVHGHVSVRTLSNDRTDNDGRKLQETRKAWLESLIQEFSA